MEDTLKATETPKGRSISIENPASSSNSKSSDENDIIDIGDDIILLPIKQEKEDTQQVWGPKRAKLQAQEQQALPHTSSILSNSLNNNSNNNSGSRGLKRKYDIPNGMWWCIAHNLTLVTQMIQQQPK